MVLTGPTSRGSEIFCKTEGDLPAAAPAPSPLATPALSSRCAPARIVILVIGLIVFVLFSRRGTSADDCIALSFLIGVPTVVCLHFWDTVTAKATADNARICGRTPSSARTQQYLAPTYHAVAGASE